MKRIIKTTDEVLADKYTTKAEEAYGTWNVYRLQYLSNDGNFYYEVLVSSK